MPHWTEDDLRALLARGTVREVGMPGIPPPAPRAPEGAGEELEKGFQGRVLRLAKAHGWLCWHAFDARRSEAGYPDLCCVRPGEMFWAELKKPGGKLTQEQTVWLSLLRSAGQEVHVWLPKDWTTIEARLTAPHRYREE